MRTYRGILPAFWILPAVLTLAACGSDGSNQPENYGNLLATPEGLVLVHSEHPDGWGRPDCLVCHNSAFIHTVNRTGLPDSDIDLPGIQELVRLQGQSSCPQCHGDNGVQQ